MAQAVAEVSEERAEGPTKAIYDDIKDTLRVPIVNLVFRVLATHPDYLRIAWRVLKPNLQTVYFESTADELRALAVDRMVSLGSAPTPPARNDVWAVMQVFHYVNPKLLLAVGALRSATLGQHPLLAELPRDQKRQIGRGSPLGAPQISMVDPTFADPRVLAIFDDIKTTLNVPYMNCDYRALAQWPDYLEAAWANLKPITGSAQYRELERILRWRTEQAIGSMPFRMDIQPHALRHAGMSEAEIDDVQGTLLNFFSHLPGLIANIAFLTAGIAGKSEAAQSPFPISLL